MKKDSSQQQSDNADNRSLQHSTWGSEIHFYCL